jgi:hypothetical protein
MPTVVTSGICSSSRSARLAISVKRGSEKPGLKISST